MKEKRKIIILDRVVRRFKKITAAFVLLFGVQYLLSYTVKSVKELEIEENENEFGSFFSVEAANKDEVRLEDAKIAGVYCYKDK